MFVKLGWKSLPITKILAYYKNKEFTVKKIYNIGTRTCSTTTLKVSEKFATAPKALLALPALQALHESLPETLHRLLVSIVSDCQNKK